MDDPVDPAGGLLRTEPSIRRLSKRIIQQQDLLRRQVSGHAWQTYLRLEEIVNERQSKLIERLSKSTQ